jgi:peptidoglycan hydrolase-like protein with peptidoglycan-binding domain
MATMALLKSGLKGEPVRRLQQKLGVPADGEFGPKTETALKAWQKSKGLTADGIAGPDTFMVMGLWELILLDNGSKGEAVKKLQEKLGVPADGKFGASTAKALREYQKQNGLSSDGKAGPVTLAKMAIYKEITPETVKQSQVPAASPAGVGSPHLGEAPPPPSHPGEAPPPPSGGSSSAAPATPATHVQAAMSSGGHRSIWDTITSAFK